MDVGAARVRNGLSLEAPQELFLIAAGLKAF